MICFLLIYGIIMSKTTTLLHHFIENQDQSALIFLCLYQTPLQLCYFFAELRNLLNCLLLLARSLLVPPKSHDQIVLKAFQRFLELPTKLNQPELDDLSFRLHQGILWCYIC